MDRPLAPTRCQAGSQPYGRQPLHLPRERHHFTPRVMADHDTTITKDEASIAIKRVTTTTNDEASTSAHDDASMAVQPKDLKDTDLRYIQYEPSHEEHYLPLIRSLISKDLSEPYSIYVYRYFLYQWGDLCYMVLHPPPP
jgi:hypothetical protein